MPFGLAFGLAFGGSTVPTRAKYHHGKHHVRYPSVWNTAEHLLLSSFAFPRILKSLLASDGHYTLTEDDRRDLSTFENFAACDDLFSVPDDNAESQSRPWDKIVENAVWRDLGKRLHGKLNETDKADGSENA